MEKRDQIRGSGGDGTTRYATLDDYLRVIRRHGIMILLITLAFLAGGLSFSLAQEPNYEASASLSFRDPIEDLRLLGGSGAADLPPGLQAASSAALVTRPEVTERAKRRLDTELSAGELQESVTATVRPQTSLVVITAEANDPRLAAAIANAFAREARIAGRDEALSRLEGYEETLEDEADGLRQRLTESLREGRADARESGTAVTLSLTQQQLQRVRTLQAVAQPVAIESEAAVPADPVSPDTVRNTILGGVVGLIVALVAAFVRDSLDRRLRSADEAHLELDLPVVGRVTDTALGYPGLAGNGALPMTEADFEAFRLLRTNLAFLAEHGGPLRSVVVTSGLAEEGKSTVSMSLASAAAVAGQSVLLVECDLRRPSFATRLGIKPSPGLTDYLAGRAAPQEILQTVELAAPRQPGRLDRGGGNGASADPPATGSSLVCIAAGTQAPNPAELLLTDRFREFLAKTSRAYDVVILDSSPLLAVVDALQIIPHVDGVLVCVRVQQTTREEARAVRAALSQMPQRASGAVVTGLHRGARGSPYYYGY